MAQCPGGIGIASIRRFAEPLGSLNPVSLKAHPYFIEKTKALLSL
jgi:hypothetical protein